MERESLEYKTRRYLLCRFKPRGGFGAGRRAACADCAEQRGQPLQSHGDRGGDNEPPVKGKAAHAHSAVLGHLGTLKGQRSAAGAGAHA